MGSWRKLLSTMVADPNPRSYTFDDAANILMQLGFVQAAKRSGSHRTFRREMGSDGAPKRGLVIGLVDAGHGPIKPVYIRAMVQALIDNGLLPASAGEDQ